MIRSSLAFALLVSLASALPARADEHKPAHHADKHAKGHGAETSQCQKDAAAQFHATVDALNQTDKIALQAFHGHEHDPGVKDQIAQLQANHKAGFQQAHDQLKAALAACRGK